MKTKFYLMLFVFAAIMTLHTSTIAQAKRTDQCDLKTDMRKLWEDHITWTRNVIFNIIDDLPGTENDLARLLKNQEDIGNAVKDFYGSDAGNQLTSLLKTHIIQAGDLLKAAKEGDDKKV